MATRNELNRVTEVLKTFTLSPTVRFHQIPPGQCRSFLCLRLGGALVSEFVGMA